MLDSSLSVTICFHSGIFLEVAGLAFRGDAVWWRWLWNPLPIIGPGYRVDLQFAGHHEQEESSWIVWGRAFTPVMVSPHRCIISGCDGMCDISGSFPGWGSLFQPELWS